MRVLVKEEAYARGISSSWSEAMRDIAGTWVKIETKHLFADQFNTAPTRLSKNGLRLMASDIMAIENDARIGRSRCSWCGKHCSSEYMFCPHCGQGSLKPLLRKKQWV